MKFYAALATVLAVSACATAPPANPMERYARLAGGAQVASENCAGYAGGYDGARRMKADADRHITAARNLGATDEILSVQKAIVFGTFNTMAAFTSRQEACNELVGKLAWEAG